MSDAITYVDVTTSKSTFDGTDIIVVQDKAASSSGATESQKYAAMQKTTLLPLKLFIQNGLTLELSQSSSNLTVTLKNASGTTLSTQTIALTVPSHTHTKSQITDFPSTFTMTATLADGTTKTLTVYGTEV